MGAVGMYGGSFDPPHAGHIRDAAQAARALGLERLVLIPVAVAPHKAAHTDAASGADRLAMLERSVRGIPGLEVSDLELRRQGPSYTVDTLTQLHRDYPGQELVLLMGTDMFLSFESWYRAGDICRLARLAVMRRGDPGEERLLLVQKEALEQEMGARVTLVDNEPLAVSSTQVRRLLTFRCAGEYLMPGVEAYIRERGLYGTGRSLRSLPMPELEAAVLPLMDPKRRGHVLGCRDTAKALAEIWGADPALAARAGLLHDITKALTDGQQDALCRAYGERPPENLGGGKTMHAFTGSLVAERIFGECPAVCGAIRYHTTGRAGMTLLEKILYIADFIEPNRDFPGVEELRQVTAESLDRGVLLGLERTYARLQVKGQPIAGATIEAIWDMKDRRA